MAILSGLISADMPARLIERKKDIMIESAAYDIIIKEGYQEGREEGREETMKDFIRLGILTDEQIMLATGLDIEEIRKIKQSLRADRGSEDERHD